MAVYRAAYCNRQDVMSATDIAITQDYIRHVDSALEAGAEEVDRVTKRRFYNEIRTNKWDWPNAQGAVPWRIWFDAAEIADATGTSYLGVAPVVTTGGFSIPDSAIFFGPWNYAPPFTFMELNRSQSYTYGLGSTPQQDVHITAAFGYWSETRPAGSLAAAVSSTTATTVTVSDSSAASPGDVLVAGSEQLLVQDAGFADTGTEAVSGGTTAQDNDNVVVVPSGNAFHAGEILQWDAEQLLITSITGNNLTVLRAYAGTVLAAHSVMTDLYAQRSLTVQRGFGGTTAATYVNGTALLACRVPGEVRELAIAEALNYVFQKTSGYARQLGDGGSVVPGGSLPDLRKRVAERYGRKVRMRHV